MSTGRSWLRSAAPWVLKTFGIGAAIVAVLTSVLVLTELLPAERMRANLQASFQEGSLQERDWLFGNRSIGFNQYNDCLLVMMVRFRTGPLSSAVAPQVIFNDWPAVLTDGAGNRLTECSIARDAVFAARPLEMYPPEQYFGYGRYVHAYRIPFNLAIALGPVSVLRSIYSIAGPLLLGGLLIAHGVFGVAALRLSGMRAAAAPFGFATLAGALLVFYGLDVFGQSLTHGPADLVLILALCWLSLRPAIPAKGTWDVAAAALGALAYTFDFLHGTVPMMFAIVLGCLALRSFQAADRLRLDTVIRVVLAFGVGTAAAVATKLLSLLALSGIDGLLGFFDQLKTRMGTGGWSYFDVLKALSVAAPQIGWGRSGIPMFALMFGMLCAIATIVCLATQTVAARDRMAIATAVASVAAIYLWYALFQSHTVVHAGFMVRLLAWPIGMGPACLLLALSSTDTGAMRTPA